MRPQGRELRAWLRMVSEIAVGDLWTAALDLAACSDDDLPTLSSL